MSPRETHKTPEYWGILPESLLRQPILPPELPLEDSLALIERAAEEDRNGELRD